MIREAPSPKTISVSEFKAHCAKQLRAVEEQGVTLQITRHGKVIAIAKPPAPPPAAAPLLGAGKQTAVLNESYAPHAPAFAEDDWELNRE